MNILVVTPWFPDSTSQQDGSFILASVDSLVAAGHQVHVLVTRPWVPGFLSGLRTQAPGLPDETITSRGFGVSVARVLSVPRDYLRFISNRLYESVCAAPLRRALRESGASIVHAHTEVAGALACTVAGAAGIPVVTTIHGINESRRFLRGIGQRKFLRRAFLCPDSLVLVGERLKPFVAAYAPREEGIHVVPNGFDTGLAAAFRDRAVLGSGPLRVISVSNLVAGKGIETTLQALALASRASLGNAWHYDIVGDGPQRARLEASCAELGIADRVAFHGRCTRTRVFELLSRADVFCLPSAPEAFGIAYLEAMACGLLAVACRGEGPEAFIDPGVTGWLVGPRDSRELADRLISIASDRPRNARLAAAGREIAWSRFTWTAHAEALIAVFESALAKEHPKVEGRCR